MPSSMIFVGLVVMWLLILVPAVARRRQEVARPSVTALSGRVLERSPRRDPDADRGSPAGRDVEVDVRHEQEPAHSVAMRTEPGGRRPPALRGEASPTTRSGDPGGGDLDNLDGWTWQDADGDAEPDAVPRPRSERAPGDRPRYRPGRGGYDPQAAALTARARYVVRQRVVLLLLVLAVGSALVAAFTLPQLWWAHGAIDLGLTGYLVFLRRQVRVEEAIRRRRAARVHASRRASDIERDDVDGHGEHPRRAAVPSSRRPVDDLPAARDELGDEEDDDEEDGDEVVGEPERSRLPEPAPSATAAKAAEPVDAPPALPRLKPMPTPPVPVGTTLVEGAEDDPALHDLESVARPDYRRASGQ